MYNERLGNVLYVSGEYPPTIGGVGDHARLLREHIELAGVSTYLMTSTKSFRKHPENVLAIAKNWGYREVYKVAAIAKNTNATIIHIHYQSGAFDLHPAINILPRILRMSGRHFRIVTTFHDLSLPYIFPKAGKLRELSVNRMLTDSHGVIFVSPEDASKAGRDVCLSVNMPNEDPRGFSSLIPVGPTVNNVHRLLDKRTVKKRFGIAEHSFVIGYVGFQQRNKGIDVFNRSLQLVRDLPGENVVMLIGASSPRSKGSSVDDFQGVFPPSNWSVVETGQASHNEMSLALAACDVCVLPFSEGLSLRRGSFMNAISHGLPVITTQPSSDLPSVTNGVNVVFVPRDAADPIARSIMELHGDINKRANIGVGAFQLSEVYSWKNNAKRTLQLYEKVVECS
tara:strand:- start:7749 stop:8939 length:1191 start_codon:yes stop_codon:yes gene_type:complete